MGDPDGMDDEIVSGVVVEDRWKEIGFHRPLAGILYNLVFVFIAAGFGIMLSVWLMPNVIFPFPSAMGYQDMTFNLFGIYFTLLDVGVGNALQRFVAQENIKHPKDAIKYLQFFIWFQMLSGLIQISVIAMWVLLSVRFTNLAYAAWFFLIYSTIQFPGMLGVFAGALEAYQQYHKFKLLDFIKYQLFENAMRIACILVGRWVGGFYPALGELMGATIGSILGIYLKDFITAFLAAYWLRPILKDVDPSWRVRDLFKVEFDREITKRCISFGVRAMLPGLIYPGAQFVATFLFVNFLPNYSSILGMFLLGNMLSQMINTFALNIAPPLSESYLNGKVHLSRNYIARGYRWNGITGAFMIGLLFAGAPLLSIIAGENFGYVGPIIQSLLFFRFAEMFASFHDRIFNGVGKPEYNIVLTIVDQGTRLTILVILLLVFTPGWFSLVISQGSGWIAKWIAGYIILRVKVLTFRVCPWQTFVAPAIAGFVEVLYISLGVEFLYPVLVGIMGTVPAAVVLVLVGIFTGPFLVFFPVYSLVGGWDDVSIAIVQKAATMSGPSKPLVNMISKISLKASKISPLHGRFPIDNKGVNQEIQELMELRRRKLEETTAAKATRMR
ncbi:hypothetical protein GF325_13365 [Candidatus Bathyarchaeota archaeon]|nr:hypothetical protein [Candidatus Bathyarchaeota archaeon]